MRTGLSLVVRPVLASVSKATPQSVASPSAVRRSPDEIVEGVQVGKYNKASEVPVKRERHNGDQMMRALPTLLLNFLGYNR